MNYEQAYLETMIKVIKTQEELIILLREDIARLKLSQTVTLAPGSFSFPQTSPSAGAGGIVNPGITTSPSPYVNPQWITGSGSANNVPLSGSITGHTNSVSGYASLCDSSTTNLNPATLTHIQANARN